MVSRSPPKRELPGAAGGSLKPYRQLFVYPTVPHLANPQAPPVVEVEGLRKSYGRTVAVDEVSFSVRQGEIFGLIGPNGAGKTTTMECVEGIRQPDGGRISVLGLNPRRDAGRLVQRIGVQLQEAQLQKRIKVGEAVDLWASLYETTIDPALLLDQLGLTAKRRAKFMTLSGGQKQRLFIALALIHDPEVVFLDELTTGLDPQARRTIWELVLGIKERGKTVFLTTHLMEEAQRLCDRVAIIEHGRVIEMGSPAELVRRHCPQREVVFTSTWPGAVAAFEAMATVTSAREEGGVFTIAGEGEEFVSEVIEFLAANSIQVRDFRTVLPTLEEVFLQLTGRSIRD